MLTVCPDWYPRFRCLAGDCRHTCCAGWEIDIDPDALALYDGMAGPLGEKLAASVDREPTPHFRLGPGERCPFLDDGNLCELIRAGGEKLLCRICRDHPRYRHFLPGRTEVGLGMCCEAAGRLILSRQEPMTLIAEGTAEETDAEAEALLLSRDRLLALASDRSIPTEGRMDNILTACGAADPGHDMARWAGFYLRLERLNEAWTGVLKRLRDAGNSVDIMQFRRHMAGRETEYEQLLSYFLHRHVLRAWEDGDIAGKAALAVLSVRMLEALGALHFADRGDFTFEDQVEYARMYSGELEYSEENLDALYDALCADPWNG